MSPSNEPVASVPAAVPGFFPLDEQLALLPGKLTPQLHGWLVRLSAWMPFARAAELLTEFTRVPISEATARRLTHAAGAAAVVLQTAEVERIERDYPSAPVQPERVVLSVDGAMVPLVQGEWAEVKTLAIGEPTATADAPQVAALSYFSRLADAETFGHLALAETHRRGVAAATAVAAVSDGAEWIQGFLDLHCDAATRILDFAHAAQRVGEIGQALWGEQTRAAQQWIEDQLHRLKERGAQPVIATLQQVQRDHPEVKLLSTNLAYLEKREGQMAYPEYRAAGWPIGSGMVESANKLVVEARLKGSGMHWARAHVDGMLALRNLVCSGRWQTDWLRITQARRPRVGARRHARLVRKVAQEQAAVLARLRASRPPRPQALPPTAPGGPSRPAPNHPWRRAFQPHMRERKSSCMAPTKL